MTDAVDPPLFGRAGLGHRIFDRNRTMVEDEITHLDPQASSQWDSLRHIRAREFGHYGGLAADDPAVSELGIDALAMPPSAGLSAGEDIPRFLWDEGFCAVAADNPTVEVLPGDPSIGSLHRRLIPALGLPLGELWDLDELADRCRDLRRYTICVATVPLHLPGGVASPANAIAIV
jgi:hypothetical protein